MSISDVWVRYYSYGGQLSRTGLQGVLDEEQDMPAEEWDLIAGATNELLEESNASRRLPLMSGARCSRDAQELLSRSKKELGAVGLFLFTAEEAEQERLAALRRTRLLDTDPDERFDRHTRAAQGYYNVSAAVVALIDDRRMFLKSAVGLAQRNLPRTASFCAALLPNTGALIVHDALEDDRYRTHPLVAATPFIRFYAGCPLRGPGGWMIGTLSVFDQKPRPFSADDQRFLQDLALRIEDEVNAH